ncbi:hypothetical protein LWI28_017512 [Acer negundo]|uniref:Uncharacterized protein n=1 Tax=Acer negundo TaxID=4023 RepID=A0AAD5J5D8_ACENE|nr:hypothetical protein LWI28_017512 [Acer negundo]
MRTTQHVPGRPDLEPPPLDEIHSPLRHHSLGRTQSGVQSSGDNHRTSSPTRLCQPALPSVNRRQHSKRSKGSTSTLDPNQLLEQMRIIVLEKVQSVIRSEFENLQTELFAFLDAPAEKIVQNTSRIHIHLQMLSRQPIEVTMQTTLRDPPTPRQPP